VQLYNIHDHLQSTGENIQLEDIPDQMYGGALPMAKSRKTKRKSLTKDEYLDDASEQPAKKAKKDKVAEVTSFCLSIVQEEVQDLEPIKVLNKRTRSGKEVVPSPLQPSIPKRKRKPVVGKLKIASEDEDAAVKKPLQLAKEIEIPVEVLAKEFTVEAAQLGLELTENLQHMAVAVDMVKATEVVQEEVGCSEALVASEALEGISNSQLAEIVTIESSSSSESRSSPASLSSSSSTSSDTDDIPLNRVYSNLNKALSPSPSTKTSKKPISDTFVPMYPSVEERLIDLQQRRIDVCKNLPADHPLQPPVIEPIQFVPADAEGADDHTGTYIANIDVSSSQPNSLIQTAETHETSIISDLISHYSGELPGYVSNLEKASDITFDEVITKRTQQHEPNQEMTSSTNLDSVLISEPIPELVVYEQLVPELSFPEQVILNQQPTLLLNLKPQYMTNPHPLIWPFNLLLLPRQMSLLHPPRF